MAKKLSKPTVKINNEPVPIVPNSFEYDEGEGETNVETESTGGGGVQIVTSDSAEDKFTSFKFDMHNTAENIKAARAWKQNPGGLSVSFSEGDLSRNVGQVSVTNNYTVPLSSDGKISLEFAGSSAI